MLKGAYDKARVVCQTALDKRDPKTAPFVPSYGLAYAHIYKGDMKSALDVFRQYQIDYTRPGVLQNLGTDVFIWNSIGRVLIEKPEEAIKAYEKGYANVLGNSPTEFDKKLWLGRLHHGKGRALAMMGKHEEAWNEAELVRKMIEEGGEAAKQFWPSYHYLAGYLKLESGNYAEAIEHLKQADLADPFSKLVLARCYEKTGDQAGAQKLYREIVNSDQVSLERALAYPEAKKKLKS